MTTARRGMGARKISMTVGASSLALALLACGASDGNGNGTTGASSSTTAADSSLTGSFANCTILYSVPGQSGSGGGGSLVVAQVGSAFDATYSGTETSDAGDLGDLNAFPKSVFALTATSAGSASFAAASESFGGPWGSCGGGTFVEDGGAIVIGDPAPAQATLSVAAGDLTVSGGAAFVSVIGAVIDVQGAAGCAANTSSDVADSATATIICPGASTVGAVDTPIAPIADNGARATGIAAGTYKCVGSVLSTYGTSSSNGANGGGTLVVTNEGPTLTAAYSGDPSLRGTVSFAATSATTATLAPAQTIETVCANPTLTAIPVGGGALHMEAGTLFFSLASNVGPGTGTCAGFQTVSSYTCTAM